MSEIEQAIVRELHQVYDPEIPVDIYELGMIYAIDIDDRGHVTVTMTLTSPACPVADSLPREVERRVNAVDGVASVRVDLVWSPPWGPHLMSEAASLALDMF